MPLGPRQIDPDVEKDKMFKRAERFGVANPELDELKKNQRKERFGIVDEETKKKQRVDKFAPLQAAKPAAAAQVPGAADFEAKRLVGAGCRERGGGGGGGGGAVGGRWGGGFGRVRSGAVANTHSSSGATEFWGCRMV